MYESKKNSARKDTYKYQKSSYQKSFRNSNHFPHHKGNKFKQKYTHSNSIHDYDEESIFSQILEDNDCSKKKNDLKEIDEYTPDINSKDIILNKENISCNININELKTQMKTDDNINNSDNLLSSKIENVSEFLSCIPENMIFGQENKKSEDIFSDINAFNNINNFIFNPNNNNDNFINNNSFNKFNVGNAINDLLQKNNELIFASNEKQNIHINLKKNVFETPRPFKMNSSSSINLTTNDIKDAYYKPKKLNSTYGGPINNSQQHPNYYDRKNSFNFMTTIQRPHISMSDKQNHSNIGISKNLNLNYFKNNNFNKNNFLQFAKSSSNDLDLGNNFNIQSSPNIPIASFNILDSNNNINKIGNIQNIPHNINKNPFHKMMPKMELNQCILKTQINNNNLFEKDKENTDILEINVKISRGENLTFKIRRYDDMFKTVKIFCEINKLDIQLMRPFIIYIIRALNSIYGIYNLNLKEEEIQFIKDIKEHFFKDEDNIEDKGDDKKNDLNKNDINDDCSNCSSKELCDNS